MSNNTPNPVTWFEIQTADPERAKAFYAGVFGWRFDDDAMPGYSFIDLGDDAPIRGGIAHSDGQFPDGAVFTVQVPDVADTVVRVNDHGGSTVADTQILPNGLQFAFVANPDGSVFGLWSPPTS